MAPRVKFEMQIEKRITQNDTQGKQCRINRFLLQTY